MPRTERRRRSRPVRRDNRALVLVVEDSPTQAQALLATLEDGGYEAVWARDGDRALELLGRRGFDLVISDIVMPGAVDGYDLCRQIKQGPQRDTPVVLLTSLSDPMDIIHGLEAGADNFLTKPCEAQHLLARLDVLLATRRERHGRRVRAGVTVYFMGRQFTITSEREQILDLLVSTFEDAVRQNHELREREAQLERSRQTLAGLYRIAVSLNACHTEGEIVETALEQALQLPSVRAGWIWLREGEGREFRLAGSRSLPPSLAAPAALARDCYCQRELLAGHLDRVTNVFECERLKSANGALRVHASVPLQCGGRVVGLFNLVGEEPGTFSEEDLTVLYGVGNQIAFALERARLWNTMESLVDERTAALRSEIAQRERAQEALRLSDSILRRVRNLVLVFGPDGGITYASPSVQQVLGYEPADVLADGWWALTFEDPAGRERERALVARAARGEVPPRSGLLERPMRDRDGKARWLLWHESKGPGDLLIGVGVDVTERRMLEEQFRQAQKMEAVGRLAGGIAHDFNNVLTAIIGYSDLLLGSASLHEEDRRDVAEIRDAAERAARLTKQLLTFSRKQVVQTQSVNLNDVVQGMEPMLKRLLGEDVTLSTVLAPDLASVEADPGQLEQVIMNLAVNARDAMPGGGKLTIETQNVELDAEYAASHANVVPGHYVLLAVSDTGHGMDESVRAHLFEPFFTTKPHGQGTGLGLATVHGIVHQSGGHIWAYSEVGYGTTMKVYLPRGGYETVPLERAPEPSALPRGTEPALPRGTETVLLVEDDAGVRKLVVSTLAKCGYHVLQASTGAAAIELARSYSGAIHLLLTDVVMPEMSGRAIAQALAGARPGLPVLYMSGYTDEAMMRHGLLEPGIELIQKPFTPGGLARRVREVLDASVRKS